MKIHAGRGRTISDVIDYIESPEKTNNGELITSYECDSRTADMEFELKGDHSFVLFLIPPHWIANTSSETFSARPLTFGSVTILTISVLRTAYLLLKIPSAAKESITVTGWVRKAAELSGTAPGCHRREPPTYEAFLALMRDAGYTIDTSRKHTTFLAPVQKKPTRLHQTAKKFFNAHGYGYGSEKKLPTVQSLREEYAGILSERKKAYAYT